MHLANLQSVLGIFLILAVCWAASENRKSAEQQGIFKSSMFVA